MSVKTNCKAMTVLKIRNKIRNRLKINYKYKIYKYPNLLSIRVCESKSENLYHSQWAFSRFLRNIVHNLWIYGSCDFKAGWIRGKKKYLKQLPRNLCFICDRFNGISNLAKVTTKKKQSDYKQIISWQFHCLPK